MLENYITLHTDVSFVCSGAICAFIHPTKEPCQETSEKQTGHGPLKEGCCFLLFIPSPQVRLKSSVGLGTNSVPNVSILATTHSSVERGC